MTYSKYLIRLGILTLMVCFIFLPVGYMPYFEGAKGFIWISIAFFSIMTAITYPIASIGIVKRSHASFTAYVFGAMAIKFFACILLIMAYYFYTKTDQISFVIPFFMVYFIYTIFETYHLSSLARNNPPHLKKNEEETI